jgi:uncharacterized protein YqhQ
VQARSRIPGLIAPFLAAHSVGGQAVVEGVMIRNASRLVIAVRRPDGEIVLDRRPWFSLTRAAWLKKPFLRGFPVLLETMINGMKALNYSATQAVEDGEGAEVKPWQLGLTLAFAVGLALGLFVVLPHFISLGMAALGLGGGAETLSFHLWDGFFKLGIFLLYLGGISLVPDVRRVFEYHGAEHKAIWAYEEGAPLEAGAARGFPRLHPRCGTAFLLIVLSLSIALHGAVIPALLAAWSPAAPVIRQAWIIAAKFLLIVPVSAVAFEMIKFAGQRRHSAVCKLLCWPGLALQRLTTNEPDDAQLEVALAALSGAIDPSPAGHPGS